MLKYKREKVFTINPRDEKILLTIKKKQRADYRNLVPFCVIQRTFPWIDGTELTVDLLRLDENGYLWKIAPTDSMGWWYGLTSFGNRECERIKYENSERKKNRNTQIISTILGVVIGFLLNEFFRA